MSSWGRHYICTTSFTGVKYREVMAGSMYKDKYGAWMLRVYAGRDPLTGRKMWKARSFRGSKRDAERALAAFVTEMSSTRPTGPSRTFGELLDRWFEARSGDWSPSTAQQTRWIINGQLRGLSDRKVAALRVEDLDRFYAALRERGGRGGGPLAGSTVARITMFTDAGRRTSATRSTKEAMSRADRSATRSGSSSHASDRNQAAEAR